MKTLKDIENLEVRSEIQKLMISFCNVNPFINDEMDFIAVPSYNRRNTNLYFSINGCKTALDVKIKVLSWFSRDCFKTEIARSRFINNSYHYFVRYCINNYFSSIDFKKTLSEEDFEEIYRVIGNGINNKLAAELINSGFDMSVIESKKSMPDSMDDTVRYKDKEIDYDEVEEVLDDEE